MLSAPTPPHTGAQQQTVTKMNGHGEVMEAHEHEVEAAYDDDEAAGSESELAAPLPVHSAASHHARAAVGDVDDEDYGTMMQRPALYIPPEVLRRVDLNDPTPPSSAEEYLARVRCVSAHTSPHAYACRLLAYLAGQAAVLVC